ncbi:MAG: alkaline phosphatase D family protein [Sporichthyaceae bacterium]
MPEHVPGPAGPSRRAVLSALLGAGAATAFAVGIPGPAAAQEPPPAEGPAPLPAPAPGAGYPFTLGVASGDPTADGLVLWTRLAPVPLAADGLGGLDGAPVTVGWQLATDSLFADIVREGSESTSAEDAHSLHIEVTGLSPYRDYYYRFTTGAFTSAVGRTQTTPALGSETPLRAAIASCAHYEHGHFTVYRQIAEAAPDLVVFLGDYIYGAGGAKTPPPSGLVRVHDGAKTRTLPDFRRRYAQYKTDVDLQAAHAAAPWVLAFDDHEVTNNWAKRFSPNPDTVAAWELIRDAGLKAYWEHLPLPRSARPSGGEMQLYRRLTWGSLATLHVLDTRQYRDPPACGDSKRADVDCAELFEPERSMLGPEQEQWLAEGLQGSAAQWDLLAQQVMFSGNLIAEEGVKTDTWEGYRHARARVLEAAAGAGTRNLVVLTGDTHKAFAAEVRPAPVPTSPPPPAPEPSSPADPAGELPPLTPPFPVPTPAPVAAPAVATEFVTASVTSEGDGVAGGPRVARAMANQPHLRFGDERRGWIALTATSTELRADFVAVAYVSQPGAPAERIASFAVASGSATLNPT